MLVEKLTCQLRGDEEYFKLYSIILIYVVLKTWTWESRQHSNSSNTALQLELLHNMYDDKYQLLTALLHDRIS